MCDVSDERVISGCVLLALRLCAVMLEFMTMRVRDGVCVRVDCGV